MTSILIADDHTLFRVGLRQYLEKDGFTKVGEAGTGVQALERLREHPWDLVILDINMPDRSGIDILRHVCASHPHTRVLVVSGFPEEQYALAVMRSGASGYVEKDQAPEECLRAVRTVLAGRRFVSPSLADMLVTELENPTEKPPHAALSQRELQILCKIAVGRSVSEIADELFISAKTVSTYRKRVLEKMGLRTNAELTTYALRHRLVQ